MNSRQLKIAVAGVLLGLALQACMAQPNHGAASDAVPAPTFIARESWEPAPSVMAELPVDTALLPVSASNPDPAALTALELCGAFQFGLDSVAGMALLRRVSDAPKYARLSPKVPELALGSSAWMIQFRGERPDPITRESWIDATCLVIDGSPHVYATGPTRDLRTGKIVSDYYPVAVPPTLSLPPLAA
jgi:hypothetical protein